MPRPVFPRALTLGVCLLALAASAGAQPFTLPRFPVDEPPGVTAYTAPMIAVLDHSGWFYTNCCDSEIVAYTGERGRREDGAIGCADPDVPACFLSLCLCAYQNPTGEPWVVSGGYIGSFGGPSYLLYDGHAGYDYGYRFGAPLIAPRAGRLCKAQEDYVNGRFGFTSAWEKFHTYYIDHGVFDGRGYATWYLHAMDLETDAQRALAPGECIDVAEGEIVARVGNQGTFAPHLHFEARVYDPARGPEGLGSKVIDPYGWTGAEPDPWTDPQENPQAETRTAPLWEDGQCSPFGPIECGPCERCDHALGCVVAPASSCKRAEAGALHLRDHEDDARDRLSWSWKRGAPTDPADYGDPTADTSYELCVYDETDAPALLVAARAPAGGECPKRNGTEPCWTARGEPPGARGIDYRDRDGTPDGLERLELRPGPDGKARIEARAGGAALGLPALPASVPLRVQLRNDAGTCWESTYSADGVRRSDERRFRARSD